MPYKNKAAATLRKRVRKQLHPERVAAEKRSWYLRSSYGITPAQFDAMFVAQGGCCALCGTATESRRMHVDHNHKTGAVRGLLCAFCNMALGWYETGWYETVKDSIGPYLRRTT